MIRRRVDGHHLVDKFEEENNGSRGHKAEEWVKVLELLFGFGLVQHVDIVRFVDNFALITNMRSEGLGALFIRGGEETLKGLLFGEAKHSEKTCIDCLVVVASLNNHLLHVVGEQSDGT